ncbi:MAG: ribosome maturation factor RimM [Deltaproteobacteria bacterium]|nr:ribosome maturation factor RimM [Deltaproteobacteria bacterium]
MDEAHSPDLLLMGSVARPHGLDGTLSIRSYAESEASFLRAGRVVLVTETGERRDYPVASARPHKKCVLLDLDGLDSVEEAEALRGAEVFIRRDALERDREDDREDEYYWFELIGLEVFLSGGRRIGTLARILPTGGSDVYVVRSGKKEILIPATREVIEEIDVDRKRMTVSEMEDLLGLNEV